MDYFFDTYAIIELIKLNPNYKEFEGLKIVTSVMNLGELYNLFLKDKGRKSADEFFEECNFEFLEISPKIMVEAVRFRHENRKANISLTDSVGYVLALEHKSKFLTGDKQFKNMPNVEFVK
ncbi:MAG: PIN domain-containing protein [Nanoarchaeota archaeon]